MSRAGKTRDQIRGVLQGQSPQKNYQQAYELALTEVRKVKPLALKRLGVSGQPGEVLVVPSLGRDWLVDLKAGRVTDPKGKDAPVSWAILVLHYLLSRPADEPPDSFISFMNIPEGRGYAKPYQGRVIGRFLHTAGREERFFRTAAQALAANPVEMGQAAFDFAVFPRAHLRVIWYAGDDELDPGVSFLYEQGITTVFCIEDIVVMSELLVGALSAQMPGSPGRSP